uniref:Uncharacterized protein n=1 Tax=Oryza nivara TaxID=4536 RepID=A0A0E0IKM9_ORYNI
MEFRRRRPPPRALPCPAHLLPHPQALSAYFSSPPVAAVTLFCVGLHGAATTVASARKRPMDQWWEHLARTHSLKNQTLACDGKQARGSQMAIDLILPLSQPSTTSGRFVLLPGGLLFTAVCLLLNEAASKYCSKLKVVVVWCDEEARKLMIFCTIGTGHSFCIQIH